MTDRERALEDLVRDFAARSHEDDLVSRARVLLDRPSRVPEAWELYDFRRLTEDRSIGTWGHGESWYVAMVGPHHAIHLLECFSQDGNTAEDALVIGAARLESDAESMNYPHDVVAALGRLARGMRS